MIISDLTASDESQVNRLFACLAEQVKLPFVQVAQAAELLGIRDVDNAESQQTIIEVSQAAIRLIDGFLLSMRLNQQSQLHLEPVSVSSVLYDTAEVLNSYARLHNTELRLDVGGKYGPVMSHSAGLKSALINIGYSFIGVAEDIKPKVVILAVRRNGKGISAGVFSEANNLSSSLLRQAKAMHGLVHQPMTDFSSDNAAGVFVADSIIESLGTTMRVARLKGATGLAATFLPSRQLSLV